MLKLGESGLLCIISAFEGLSGTKIMLSTGAERSPKTVAEIIPFCILKYVMAVALLVGEYASAGYTAVDDGHTPVHENAVAIVSACVLILDDMSIRETE